MTIFDKWRSWNWLERAQYLSNMLFHLDQAGISVHSIINNLTDWPDETNESQRKNDA